MMRPARVSTAGPVVAGRRPITVWGVTLGPGSRPARRRLRPGQAESYAAATDTMTQTAADHPLKIEMTPLPVAA